MKLFIKKKHKIYLIGLLIIFLFSTLSINAEETTINICCTNSILADFTKNLLKENVNIEYIMPPGACPIHFDTNPSDLSKITKADIIISLGIEPWLNNLLESSGNTKYNIITCIGLGEWSIPSGAKQYVGRLRGELSKFLPELNETINSNAQNYINIIDETSYQLQQLIIDKGYLNKNVICMQWQADFAEYIGLNVTLSYAPPESLSTQDMINISKAASVGNICVVIDNLQSGTDFGARISSESGASHVIFTNFPEALPGTDTYLDMIRYNTNQLINGISTYEYKQGEIAELEKTISAIELQRNFSIFGVVILALLTIIFIILYKRK
jgi:ABC-type Zn uptake system ZnuABC Zn-binding protein ZnuA